MLAKSDVVSYFGTAKPVLIALALPYSLFIVASFLPVVWGFHLGIPVSIVACLVTAFYLKPVQQTISELPYGPSQVCVNFPFTVITLGWLVVLLVSGKPEGLKVVPGFLLSMLTGLWPIFAKSRKKEVVERRINYMTSALIATFVYLLILFLGVIL